MISLYSTWWVKPGCEEEVYSGLKKLAQQVLENEKGTLMYLVNVPNFKSPEVPQGKNLIVSEPQVRPGTIVFFEKYASWDSFKAHLYGQYFTGFVKEYHSKFVLKENGDPFVQVVFLNQITGFTRPT